MKETIIRKSLLSAVLDPSKITSRVEIKQIDFKPSQETGLHFHPCPVVGYIASGSALLQIEGKPSRILFTGDAFLEPANTRILHFDNASATDPMTFIALYLLSEDEHELIRMLD